MAKRKFLSANAMRVESTKQDIKEIKRAIIEESDHFKRSLLSKDLEMYEDVLKILEGGAR